MKALRELLCRKPQLDQDQGCWNPGFSRCFRLKAGLQQLRTRGFLQSIREPILNAFVGVALWLSMFANTHAGVHFNAKGLQAHGRLWAEKVGAYLDKVKEDAAPGKRR